LQDVNAGYGNGDRELGVLLDDGYHILGGQRAVVGKAERIEVRGAIEIDTDSRLRAAKHPSQIRSPISKAHSGLRSWIEVKYGTDFLRQTGYVGIVRSLLLRIVIQRIGKETEQRWQRCRNHAKHRVF